MFVTIETHPYYKSAYASLMMGYADGTFDSSYPPRIIENEAGDYCLQINKLDPGLFHVLLQLGLN
jgi:hypothetical protein